MISPKPATVKYEKGSNRYLFEFRPSQLYIGFCTLIFSICVPLLFYIFEIEVKGKQIVRHDHHPQQQPVDTPYEFPLALLLFPLMFGGFAVFFISSFPWSRLIIDPMNNSCKWEQVRLPLFSLCSIAPFLFVSKSFSFTMDQLCDETSLEDSGWRKGKSKSRRSGSHGHHKNGYSEEETSPRRTVYDVRIRIVKSKKEVEKLESAKNKAIERLTKESDGYPDPAVMVKVEEDFERSKTFTVTVAREDNQEALQRIKKEWDECLKKLKMKSGEQWVGKKSD